MESKDKWLMFKNYMHNELGVDKDTIRTWIQEACREEARILIDNTFNSISMKSILINAMTETLVEDTRPGYVSYTNEYRSVRKEVIDAVAENILEEIKRKG